MARKLPSQWTPAYRHRMEAAARKAGVTLDQLIANPTLKRAARGHAHTPEHRFRPKHIKAQKTRKFGKVEQWEVGNYDPADVLRPLSASEVTSYQDAKTPTPDNVLAILGNIKGTFTRVAVLWLAEKYEAGERRESGKAGGTYVTLTWTAGRPATAMFRQLLNDAKAQWRGLSEADRDALMIDVASQTVNAVPDRATKVVAWSVAESGQTQTRRGSE